MPTIYTKKDHCYPNGRKHSDWHIFEVSKASDSYWVLAGSLARGYTLFQDLIKHKYISFSKEHDVSVNSLFEKTYKRILLKYVGDERKLYPVEVKYSDLMIFINKERGLL